MLEIALDAQYPKVYYAIAMKNSSNGDTQDESHHQIKACVNCRHLEILEDSEEIEGLADTAFLRSRCRILDIEFTDHYAFPTGGKTVIIDEKPGECPLWEPWDSDDISPRSTTMSENVMDKIRIDAEDFISEMMKEYYMHLSGRKDTLEIGPIFDKYKHLFSLELAHQTKAMMEGASGLALTGARNLHSFMIGEYISSETKDITQELMNHQSTLSIEIDGEKLNYHGITPKMRNESSRDKRREMSEKWLKLETDELNPRRMKRWNREFDIIKGEDYRGYVPFVQTLTAIEYKPLAKMFQRFLDETRDLYVETFDGLCRELVGIPIDEAASFDVGFMLRGEKYDKYYSKDGLIPAAKATLEGLGLGVDGIDAITLDVEEREKKRPRAFCAPVRLGREVYVVTRPMGGRQDYGSLMHELGHGYHFAFTDTSLPIELRYFGDRAISEGFAFLFNYLYDDAAWLTEYIGVPKDEVKDVVRFGMATKLYMLRRYIAKLKYELALFDDWDIETRADEYSRTLTDELVFRHFPEAYLFDLDSGFYSADYLRAWFWEVQLRHYLKENFGPKWFANPDCVPTLVEMWGWGQQFSPEEMAQKLGMEGLTIDPQIVELKGSLG